MALDRSPESSSPQLNSRSLLFWFQLVTLRVGPVLTPKNKIDKGPQRDAKYQVSQL